MAEEPFDLIEIYQIDFVTWELHSLVFFVKGVDGGFQELYHFQQIILLL